MVLPKGSSAVTVSENGVPAVAVAGPTGASTSIAGAALTVTDTAVDKAVAASETVRLWDPTWPHLTVNEPCPVGSVESAGSLACPHAALLLHCYLPR